MKEAAQNYDGTHALESYIVSDLWFYKKISTLKSTHYFLLLGTNYGFLVYMNDNE